jgi:hypothetical protein
VSKNKQKPSKSGYARRVLLFAPGTSYMLRALHRDEAKLLVDRGQAKRCGTGPVIHELELRDDAPDFRRFRGEKLRAGSFGIDIERVGEYHIFQHHKVPRKAA